MTGEPTASEVKKGAGAFMALGVLVTILGFIIMGAPLMTGLTVMMLIGGLLLAAGVIRVVHGFKAHGAGAKLLAILAGILTVVAGGLILARPGLALGTLALILAIYFLVEGILTAVAAFQEKPEPGWGWLLCSGFISIILGLLIWRQWPLSGVWAIGVLVGVRVVMAGFSMIFAGSETRNIAAELAAAENPGEEAES